MWLLLVADLCNTQLGKRALISAQKKKKKQHIEPKSSGCSETKSRLLIINIQKVFQPCAYTHFPFPCGPPLQVSKLVCSSPIRRRLREEADQVGAKGDACPRRPASLSVVFTGDVICCVLTFKISYLYVIVR